MIPGKRNNVHLKHQKQNGIPVNILQVLYANIDLKLRNKSHVPMYYKIVVTCVFNGHKIDIL